MNDQEDPSVEDYTPEEWKQVKTVKDALTQQRDSLAKAYRKFEAGEGSGLEPLKELDKAREAIRKALPSATPSHGGPEEFLVRDLATGYWALINQRKESAPTGFIALNKILSGGIESKRLVCMLGAPNTGKTTFVHQMADEMACSGRPVLYVTSEDSPNALFAKTLARIGKVSYTAVLKGYQSEQSQINAALSAQLSRASTDRLLYLDASNGITLDDIRDKAQAHFAKYTAQNGGGPGIIIVDYLQRIARAVKSDKGSPVELREIVTQVTEKLRAMACNLECGMIAIASQNRTGYTRSESTGAMASAKESGDIEYTCDVLMSLSEEKERAAPSNMTAIRLYVDKNRQGQRGESVSLNFWADRQQFTEVGNQGGSGNGANSRNL